MNDFVDDDGLTGRSVESAVVDLASEVARMAERGVEDRGFQSPAFKGPASDFFSVFDVPYMDLRTSLVREQLHNKSATLSTYPPSDEKVRRMVGWTFRTTSGEAGAIYGRTVTTLRRMRARAP